MAFVGEIELLPLTDGRGTLGTYAELFAGAAPERWDPYRAAYPELFAAGGLHIPYRCFLVRGPGPLVLVDTGVGAGNPDIPLDGTPQLMNELEAAGVQPADVDIVFLTHLHTDHIGWNVIEGEPSFPNARYMTHEQGWNWATARQDARRPYIDPLAPRVELISGEVVIAPGVQAFHTPGHLPGHMSLRLTSGDARGIILGDVAVHPAQLREPELEYHFDFDKEEAVRTRREVLDELDEKTLVACGHYPGEGVGSVVDDDGAPYWISSPPVMNLAI